MGAWTNEELRKMAGTDDLHIAPFRKDGVTYGTPIWVWSVVVDDGLYVRGYNGQNSSWYQAALWSGGTDGFCPVFCAERPGPPIG
jgi:hypothetical protein